MLAVGRRSGILAAVGLVVLLLSPGPAPVAALAQVVTTERPVTVHSYAGHVADAARRFGIPETWIWAVMRVESNGDARAVSTAGAMGLMQIMPATWAELRARHGLGTDPFAERDNIMAGAAYLRAMFDRYGNATAMLAAYNAGPGRYDEHLSRGRPLPAETRAYLNRLASITGDRADVQLATAVPSDPFAWRRAALFATRSNLVLAAKPNTEQGHDDAQPKQAPTDRADFPVASTAPPSIGLFVARSGEPPR